jgi:hypothetical protein
MNVCTKERDSIYKILTWQVAIYLKIIWYQLTETEIHRLKTYTPEK